MKIKYKVSLSSSRVCTPFEIPVRWICEYIPVHYIYKCLIDGIPQITNDIRYDSDCLRWKEFFVSLQSKWIDKNE